MQHNSVFIQSLFLIPSSVLIRFFLVLLLVVNTGCTPFSPQRTELHGETMGTTYNIAYFASSSIETDNPDSEQVHQQIKHRLEQINQVASTYISNSELSLLNQHSSTDIFPISQDLHLLLKESIKLAHTTSGALDVTVGPLVNLWGFGPDKQPNKIPSEKQIEDARVHAGIEKLDLQIKGVKKKTPALYVDLSTIAKGFAVDEIAEVLERFGIQDYLVEIGGELRVKGQKADGQAWRVAIEKPVNQLQNVQRILQPGNNGVATSGDYRNYIERDGVRYSHIIDPETGRPISHKLVSVTVIHPSCMLADGLATGFMVLGQTKALELANKEDIAALLIEKLPNGDFKETYSKTMEKYINQQ